MATHTPGPWFVSPPQEGDFGQVFYTIGEEDVSDKPAPSHFEDTIAEVWDGNHDGAANARLIAAAPTLVDKGRELLLAVEALCDWMNGNDVAADHRDQRPQDFDRLSGALVSFRAVLAQAEGR